MPTTLSTTARKASQMLEHFQIYQSDYEQRRYAPLIVPLKKDYLENMIIGAMTEKGRPSVKIFL